MELSNYFWYYGTTILTILLTSLAVYFANKNKHHLVKWILIVSIIISFLVDEYPANVIIYLYFLLLIIRWIYNKVKKPKLLNRN